MVQDCPSVNAVACGKNIDELACLKGGHELLRLTRGDAVLSLARGLVIASIGSSGTLLCLLDDSGVKPSNCRSGPRF
jgi:hypothetical protein